MKHYFLKNGENIYESVSILLDIFNNELINGLNVAHLLRVPVYSFIKFYHYDNNSTFARIIFKIKIILSLGKTIFSRYHSNLGTIKENISYLFLDDQQRNEFLNILIGINKTLGDERSLYVKVDRSFTINCKGNFSLILILFKKYSYHFGTMFTLFLIGHILNYFRIYELYLSSLTNTNLLGTVTISDAHPHAYVFTAAANANRIQTYTLQHGNFGPLWFPIISKTIFTWGLYDTQILIENGMPKKAIKVVGNPYFEGKNIPRILKKSFVKTIILTRSYH